MNLDILHPEKSNELFGLKENFVFFKNLIENENLPKVNLITGEKGIGKSTLINHLIHFFFDSDNYDLNRNLIVDKNNFYNQLTNGLSPNVINLNFENSPINISDIRSFKIQISKTAINGKKRFIVMDDVDSFNVNSLNALLKILEEPTKNNYFFLINNKSQNIIDTVKSRCVEVKIFLKLDQRNHVIDCLMKKFNQTSVLNKDILNISPGRYLLFNNFFDSNKIDLNDSFIKNINHLIEYFIKEKKIFYKDLITFYIEYYLNHERINNKLNKTKFLESRSFILKNINDFFSYNLNRKTLLNSLENNLNG